LVISPHKGKADSYLLPLSVVHATQFVEVDMNLPFGASPQEDIPFVPVHGHYAYDLYVEGLGDGFVQDATFFNGGLQPRKGESEDFLEGFQFWGRVCFLDLAREGAHFFVRGHEVSEVGVKPLG